MNLDSLYLSNLKYNTIPANLSIHIPASLQKKNNIFLPELRNILIAGISNLKLFQKLGINVLLVYLVIKKLFAMALSVLYTSNTNTDFRNFSGYYTL